MSSNIKRSSLAFLASACALAFVTGAATAPLVVAASGCTPSQGKSAAGIAVTVASDACAELATQPEPLWVPLACAVEGGAAALVDAGAFGDVVPPGFVRVRMPRAEWDVIRLASIARASRSSEGGAQ